MIINIILLSFQSTKMEMEICKESHEVNKTSRMYTHNIKETFVDRYDQSAHHL